MLHSRLLLCFTSSLVFCASNLAGRFFLLSTCLCQLLAKSLVFLEDKTIRSCCLSVEGNLSLGPLLCLSLVAVVRFIQMISKCFVFCDELLFLCLQICDLVLEESILVA